MDYLTRMSTDIIGARKAREAMKVKSLGSSLNEWNTCLPDGRIRASNPCCFVGDTLVDTSEGAIEFKDLHEMYESGKELPHSFSYDLTSELPTLSKINRVWISGEVTQVVEVCTERGITLRCTPDHRFLLYNGDYVAAKDLVRDTRLRCFGLATQVFIGSPQTRRIEEQNDRVVSVSLITLDSPESVYDMEVEGVHNFGVRSANTIHSIIVHNSEYMFLDNTACNLASINLLKFYDCATDEFDCEKFKQACYLWIEDAQAEIGYIKEYLPKELSEDEVLGIANEVKKDLGSDVKFGVLMGMVMKKTKGQADGKLVKRVVESIL